MTAHRNSRGRSLTDYPRPSVAVDTAVLTFADDALSVLLVESDGELRLPGTFLHEGERLADAVARSLRTKAGIDGLDPRQLHVFDALDRDDRGWVLSVAHVTVVPLEQLGAAQGRLTPIAEATGLRYDHDEIVGLAVDWIRERYASSPDPLLLLGDAFTLRDLQRLHETIAGTSLPRDSFRRSMERQLTETGRRLEGVVGKPPRLFRRR